MPSTEQAARDYGHISIDDERLVVVHLLLFGFDMQAPSVADARRWAEHYQLDQRPNHLVLVGTPGLLGPGSRALVPGLWVVDPDFVLRFDSAGNHAPDDLWTKTWPGVAALLPGS